MAQSCDLLYYLSVKVGGVVIPVMEYADDTVLLIDDNLEMADNQWGLLMWFEAATGLQINNRKTQVFEVNTTITGNKFLKGGIVHLVIYLTCTWVCPSLAVTKIDMFGKT